MTSSPLNREERINALQQIVVNLKSFLKAQSKKIQRHRKYIGEQRLQFDNLEDEFAPMQDQVKLLAEDVR